MQSFVVDPRDNAASDSCNTCCCKEIALRPGEVNKISLNYAPWSVPIGGRGLTNTTQFNLERRFEATPQGAPVNTDYRVATLLNTPGTVDLSDNAESEVALSYSLWPMTGPAHGDAAINATTGELVYTPDNGYVGYDTLYFSTDDGTNKIVRQVQIKVSAAADNVLPDIGFTAAVSVPNASVNPHLAVLTFPLQSTPEAQVGDIYRLTVRQPTLDCDCNEYVHLSCYDIVIGKC